MSTTFTPYTGLAGGMLIGLAAMLLLFINGRIAGVSGMLGGLLRPQRGDRFWRMAFLIGLILGSAGYLAVVGDIEMAVSNDWRLLIVAGLLVGYGSRLGSGCTSGHGVCGVGRGSQRSIVATATFMTTGVLTVLVYQHLMGA